MSLSLQDPLMEFRDRIDQIKSIVVAVETASRDPSVLRQPRNQIDLSGVGFSTVTTTNSMALVFLASSYEEFIREVLVLSAKFLSSRYSALGEESKVLIRNSYWGACLDRLRLNKSILTKGENVRSIDQDTFSKIRKILESAQKLVISDDALDIDCTVFVQHSNNFRPIVVNELAKRIGIQKFVEGAAEDTRMRNYFGTTTRKETASRLTNRLDEFYDRRNAIVHSLTSSSGYGVEAILDYLILFQNLADSVKDFIERKSREW